MERLTERKTNYPSCDKKGNLTQVDYIEIKDKKLAEEKLCLLEDVEELCEKMVSQSIYEIYYGANEIHEENYIECQALYNFKEKRIELVDCFEIEHWYKLDDYGKTWALRKEDLENEQKRNI